MSTHEQAFPPLSLAQHFEPPTDYRGVFGWMCGYSADASFLDDAAERFTRNTRAQRAYMGDIHLALMLDPGNENISMVDAPGVMHLPLRRLDDKPFVLLHAKVAILGFRHEGDSSRWRLRLIVSTGNWTHETLEESLDLAWCAELASEDLEAQDEITRQVCADMTAAWEMLDWLRTLFDTRLFDAEARRGVQTRSTHAGQLFETWIGMVLAAGKADKPRFIDNRKRSFIDQLPEMVAATGITSRRNYLAMGSGFYEGTSDKDEVPSMLRNIVDTLQEHQVLTARAEIDVFVNPQGCQAVATSLGALKASNFVVRPAGQPSYFGQTLRRALHAKFLFSANYRENSNVCNSAWIYLGSGNLTGPGFGNQMSARGGNLEAGVVFAPDELYWKVDKEKSPRTWISNVLPVQWETDVESLAVPLVAGSDLPEREVQHIAAPVAWMLWHDEGDLCWLSAPAGETVPFAVISETGNACAIDELGRHVWRLQRPRQLTLCWDADGKRHQAAVPVIDEFGRFAATALPQIDIDEAWWQLANFPMPPDDDDLTPENIDDIPSLPQAPSEHATASQVASYPIRKMMQLIEDIAAKQTAISQVDWPAWCARLEQCLIQASTSAVLKKFSELHLNPISPLWEVPFRPTFAETSDTPEGQRYEAVLCRVEAEWKVASLSKIGGSDETAL